MIFRENSSTGETFPPSLIAMSLHNWPVYKDCILIMTCGILVSTYYHPQRRRTSCFDPILYCNISSFLESLSLSRFNYSSCRKCARSQVCLWSFHPALWWSLQQYLTFTSTHPMQRLKSFPPTPQWSHHPSWSLFSHRAKTLFAQSFSRWFFSTSPLVWRKTAPVSSLSNLMLIHTLDRSKRNVSILPRK